MFEQRILKENREKKYYRWYFLHHFSNIIRLKLVKTSLLLSLVSYMIRRICKTNGWFTCATSRQKNIHWLFAMSLVFFPSSPFDWQMNLWRKKLTFVETYPKNTFPWKKKCQLTLCNIIGFIIGFIILISLEDEFVT